MRKRILFFLLVFAGLVQAQIPARENITLYQGASWRPRVIWTDSNGDTTNITNYTIRMHIRSEITSDDTLLTASTDNGLITINTNQTGTFDINIPASMTAALNFRTAYYDIEAVSGAGSVVSGIVYRLMMGRVTLSKEVTR